MIKGELEQWAIRHGFQQDRFGNYQKTREGKTYRLKLSKVAMRYEARVNIVDHNEWIRLHSAYYKDLTLDQNDRLRGLN